MDRIGALEQQRLSGLQRNCELKDKLLAIAEENADLRRQLAKNSDNRLSRPRQVAFTPQKLRDTVQVDP